MHGREKTVVVCNNKFFENIIVSGLETGSYELEELSNICKPNIGNKYESYSKLIIAEISSLGNDHRRLFQFIEKLKSLTNVVFLMICGNHQQDLAVKAINLGATDVIFTPCEIEIMQKRIKNAFESITMKQALRIDPLTQLYNRIAFENKVESLLQNIEKSGKEKAAFIMIDLDNFKELNDSFGHEIGDRILVKMAELLQAYFSDKTIVARLGGDEFAAFALYEEGKDCLINEMQEFFSNLNFDFRERQIHVKVTSSVGIAFSNDCGNCFKDLYRNADKAQYQSKNTGKNKITIYKHNR